MDIAIILEHLVPAANYFGSLTKNTKEEYNKLAWRDTRKKPTWAEITAAQSAAENKNLKSEKLIELIDKKIRSIAIKALKSEGKIDENGEITDDFFNQITNTCRDI
jgi:hypothetical protein